MGSHQLLSPYLVYEFDGNGMRSWIGFCGWMITTLVACCLLLLPLDATGCMLFACNILPAAGVDMLFL